MDQPPEDYFRILPLTGIVGAIGNRNKIGEKLKTPFVKLLVLAGSAVIGATLASAGTISYTCDPTIDTLGPASTCATLNSTITGL
jgi:hypothetical protein